MDWARYSAVWPNAECSRFLDVAPHRWHVQEAGIGKCILLLHGAGASTHTWAGMFLPLAQHGKVFALDLPGQGFTVRGRNRRCGLPEMAADIRALLEAESLTPTTIIGHSAGAAIALEIARSMPGVRRVISLNGALEGFGGLAGILFPVMARLLSLTPLPAAAFARICSSRGQVRRLVEATGSRIPECQLTCYRALISDRAHVDATLEMMADWELGDLIQVLPSLEIRTVFLVGTRDRTVPPSVSGRAASRMPDAEVISLDGLGHLMQEEDPKTVLDHVLPVVGDGLSRSCF
ncbi:alpha/beta fold hydrolase BchO [Halovulum sp. GXIMD14794]